MPARAKTPQPATRPPRGIAGFSDGNEGYDEDGYPQGLLMWGQAGIFNGIDDRRVITALSDSVTGVVKPARVTAGTGLTINVSAGWLGIASCDDGTTSVVGAGQSFQLGAGQGVMAGPASGNARRDILWCDTYPNDARWRLSVIRESETLGRPGLPLAMITVPAGANLASQFTYSRMVPTFGAHSDVSFLQNSSNNNTRITPLFPIAPWMIRNRSHFKLTCWGWGRWAGTVRSFGFRIPQANSPFLWLSVHGQGFPVGPFSWKCEAVIQCRMNRQNIMIALDATCRPQQGAAGNLAANGVTAVQTQAITQWNPDIWQEMALETRFNQVQSGQLVECVTCVYETIEPFDFP